MYTPRVLHFSAFIIIIIGSDGVSITSSRSAESSSILCRHLMALSSVIGSTRIPDRPTQ